MKKNETLDADDLDICERCGQDLVPQFPHRCKQNRKELTFRKHSEVKKQYEPYVPKPTRYRKESHGV